MRSLEDGERGAFGVSGDENEEEDAEDKYEEHDDVEELRESVKSLLLLIGTLRARLCEANAGSSRGWRLCCKSSALLRRYRRR